MGDFIGRTFDNQTVTPKADAKLYRKLLGDGILTGGAITTSGFDLTVAAGSFLIAGRVFELASGKTITTAFTNTYFRIKIKLDMTGDATTEAFTQAAWEDVEYSASTSFAALTQEDINGTGETYEFELCTGSLDAGGITAVLTKWEAIEEKINPESASAHIVEVTADKTLALSDAGTLQKFNSSSNYTLTVPPNSSVAFPIGTEIEVMRYGSGTVTLAQGSGVTINKDGSVLTIANQYTSVVLKKFAADIWVAQGNLG